MMVPAPLSRSTATTSRPIGLYHPEHCNPIPDAVSITDLRHSGCTGALNGARRYRHRLCQHLNLLRDMPSGILYTQELP